MLTFDRGASRQSGDFFDVLAYCCMLRALNVLAYCRLPGAEALLLHVARVDLLLALDALDEQVLREHLI